MNKTKKSLKAKLCHISACELAYVSPSSALMKSIIDVAIPEKSVELLLLMGGGVGAKDELNRPMGRHV